MFLERTSIPVRWSGFAELGNVPEARLRISLLGPLQVADGEKTLKPSKRRNVERLLAYLLLQPRPCRSALRP